jgi:hypothetical protein
MIAPCPSVNELNVCTLSDELYGPWMGPETSRSIKLVVARLDTLLPGIRLQERLLGIPNLTHQKIADVLAENGWPLPSRTQFYLPTLARSS